LLKPSATTGGHASSAGVILCAVAGMLSGREGSAVGVTAEIVPPHARVGNNITMKMIINGFIAPSSETNEKPIGVNFGQSAFFDYEVISDFLRSID
jgi:hypothetical protein